MKTNPKFPMQSRRQPRRLPVFAGTLPALLCLARAAWANGAVYYLAPNGGATAGFDVASSDCNQNSVQWIASSSGIGTLVAFPTTSPHYQMTFGNGGKALPDLSGMFAVTLNSTRFHGIDVTSAGSGKYCSCLKQQSGASPTMNIR